MARPVAASPSPVTVKLEGGKELDMALHRLGEKVARKLAMRALRAGGRPILTAAKQNAPVGTSGPHPGLLKSTVKMRAGKRSRRNRHHRYVIIGSVGRAAYYAGFVEHGHYAGKGGKGAFIPPHPWLRPAFDVHKDRALRTIMSTLRDEIEAQAGKP